MTKDQSPWHDSQPSGHENIGENQMTKRRGSVLIKIDCTAAKAFNLGKLLALRLARDTKQSAAVNV